MIESHGITIIRTNPDTADFNMNRLINQIYKHIIESTKNQTKVSTEKSLIDDLSKRLLELEFKSKSLKWLSKTFYQITKNEKYTIKNKINKNWKTTYCFGCKDYTQSFRPEKVNITNKVLIEKSNCIVSRSNKSTFLKQKIN